MAGATIPVQVTVNNYWPKDSGDYTVRFVLSTDDTITSLDKTIATVTRKSLLGNSFQRWTEQVAIPTGTTPGRYYVGVIVDPDNAIAEVNEQNNAQASDGPIQVTAAVTTKPDLVGAGLKLNPASASYHWGDSITIGYNVKDVGNVAAGASSVLLSLVDNPQSPGFQLDIATLSLSGLTAGASGGSNFRYTLPAVAPASFAGGPLYVRMVVDSRQAVDESNETNNSGQGPGLDWVPIPLATPTTAAAVADARPDLVGVSLTATPTQDGYEWGDVLRLAYTFKNQGHSDAHFFNANVYLATKPTVDAGDLLLRTLSVSTLDFGDSLTYTPTIGLPASVPAGMEDGRLYIGVLLDPEGRIDEANEANNSGQGRDRLDPDHDRPAAARPASPRAGDR